MNDNRNYRYDLTSSIVREEYAVILNLVKKGTVIDLGCGDGSLLSALSKKGITGEGIDISKSGIESAKRKGLKVKEGRIDTKLPYSNKSFDYAICNVTLQMTMYPEILLSEMKRIAKKQIVTFPNFAFLANRISLLIQGKMPTIMTPGYKWYSTGHIHQLSLTDYKEICKLLNLKILSVHHIYPKRIFFIPKYFLRKFPNLFASTAIFLTES